MTGVKLAVFIFQRSGAEGSRRLEGVIMSVVPSITEFDSRQRSAARDRRASPGRYSRSANTRTPAGGLARVPLAQRADVTTGAVDDPYEAGARIEVVINRRVDILEMERSHKRISEAAYQAGRKIQNVLEAAGQVAGSSWATESRGDRAVARDGRLVHSLENAAAVRALADDIRARVGMCDMRLLKRVLGERMSFADCAALEGKGGVRGQGYVAARFRDALEELADGWASKGRSAPTPNDKHKAAAGEVTGRQAASIRGGATLLRSRRELSGARAAARVAKPGPDRAAAQEEVFALEATIARLEGQGDQA